MLCMLVCECDGSHAESERTLKANSNIRAVNKSMRTK